MTKITPVHPGEVLSVEFMEPHGLSANKLARTIGVPPNRISSVVAGRRSITADTALRLSAAFETTPEFWLNLQSRFDLETARDRTDYTDVIRPISETSASA